MESILNAASAAISMMEEGFYIDLNWLGRFIRLLIEGVGSVGLGVIVFTLVLKAITTPFDIYQRVVMRKQTLIMRNMKGDLEKLQKQYANDKVMYNKKMMELQKKNGYSMFGACLPMIISFVILMVAIAAFQSYSQYANLSMYEQMAKAYNGAFIEYTVDGKDYHFGGEDELTIGWDVSAPHSETEDGETIVYTVYQDGEITRMRVESQSPEKYIFYTYTLYAEGEGEIVRNYYVNVDKLYTEQSDAEIKAAIDAYVNGTEESEGVSLETACANYVRDLGATAAAKWFREENDPSFLWIKNVWYPDVVYSHPIQDYESFSGSVSKKILSENWEGEKSISDVFSETEYNNLTYCLSGEKSQPNGYFIMIVLTIGLMVLSQFIAMRSQKESSQYGTLDGQGAKTQKMMMIMLPLIYAITGFMWTAAFSIYIAVSSIIGILVTLLSNLFIGIVFKKREEEEIRKQYSHQTPASRGKKDANKKS